MSQPIPVQEFRTQLEKHPEFLSSLAPATAYRYRNGVLPAVVSNWLLQHPALLRALAEDAERHQTAAPPATEPTA